MADNQPCPCGSGDVYVACCGRFLEAGKTATTAEQLMRSRYTANVLRNISYLRQTWHPDTRPERIDLPPFPWRRLQVVATDGGGVDDDRGVVEFLAWRLVGHILRLHHEISRFVREQGSWLYLDGEVLPEPPVDLRKTGRNQPCPCGSGKKFKKCCLPWM